MPRIASILAILLGCGALSACEQSWILDGKIAVDSSVARDPAEVILIVDGDEEEIADWSALTSTDSVTQSVATFEREQRSYDYRYDEFGSSPHAVYLAAFLDLDGDRALGPGEPFGEYANNPIIDARWGSTAAPTTASFAIDQTAP